MRVLTLPLLLVPLFLVRPTAAAPPEAPRIEVAFVLDATGSMGPYIDEARQRIRAIADDLATGEPAPAVRFALVAYRDRGDDFVTRVGDFSADIDRMRARLDRTQAAGGGDHPEAVLEGLHAAVTELAWSEDPEVLKLVYLIGDAPAQHYAGGPTEAEVAAAARARGIVLHTIACGGNLGEGGEKTWDRLARYTEGRGLRLTDPHRAARRGDDPRAAAPTTTLAEAVGGTTRAYSSSVGVDYEGAPTIDIHALAAPTGARSGLLGAHARWVRDPLSWSDLWAAHTSVLPAAERPALPSVDFARHHVLVTGGADSGLAVDDVRAHAGSRAASLRPVDRGGVTFTLVPVSGGSR